ncbi:hypothetical protein DIPPA_58659 [Diplonema papillatum]|nr:hypothetical protein DIPPA_58659 [Diplonema papillatum]
MEVSVASGDREDTVAECNASGPGAAAAKMLNRGEECAPSGPEAVGSACREGSPETVAAASPEYRAPAAPAQDPPGDPAPRRHSGGATVEEHRVPTAEQQQVPTGEEQQVPPAGQQQVPTAEKQQLPTAEEQQVPTTEEQQVPTAKEQQVPTAETQQIPAPPSPEQCCDGPDGGPAATPQPEQQREPAPPLRVPQETPAETEAHCNDPIEAGDAGMTLPGGFVNDIMKEGGSFPGLYLVIATDETTHLYKIGDTMPMNFERFFQSGDQRRIRPIKLAKSDDDDSAGLTNTNVDDNQFTAERVAFGTPVPDERLVSEEAFKQLPQNKGPTQDEKSSWELGATTRVVAFVGATITAKGQRFEGAKEVPLRTFLSTGLPIWDGAALAASAYTLKTERNAVSERSSMKNDQLEKPRRVLRRTEGLRATVSGLDPTVFTPYMSGRADGAEVYRMLLQYITGKEAVRVSSTIVAVLNPAMEADLRSFLMKTALGMKPSEHERYFLPIDRLELEIPTEDQASRLMSVTAQDLGIQREEDLVQVLKALAAESGNVWTLLEGGRARAPGESLPAIHPARQQFDLGRDEYRLLVLLATRGRSPSGWFSYRVPPSAAFKFLFPVMPMSDTLVMIRPVLSRTDWLYRRLIMKFMKPIVRPMSVGNTLRALRLGHWLLVEECMLPGLLASFGTAFVWTTRAVLYYVTRTKRKVLSTNEMFSRIAQHQTHTAVLSADTQVPR